MTLSAYVADFIAAKGVTHVFSIMGGASLHLIHSLERNEAITQIFLNHEQACAMAADGYSRATGRMGVAVSTSGPGATNLLTGVCGAYYDSVPLMLITGQVATFRDKKRLALDVRQFGFQETDVVQIFQHATKYAVKLEDAKDIRYEMEKAYHLAHAGRPGPVLIDIPDNLQRAEVTPAELVGYKPEREPPHIDGSDLLAVKDMLEQSRRPVLIIGWGVHLAAAEAALRAFVHRHHIPFAPTWAAADVLPSTHEDYIGTFGTHGTRYANFAVQNADLIISIGSKLDTKATGSPPSTFARNALKIMVDIDGGEIAKFKSLGIDITLGIKCDAKVFLEAVNRLGIDIDPSRLADWKKAICGWKQKYPVVPGTVRLGVGIDPYLFMDKLSNALAEGDIVISDTGCALAWLMQGLSIKEGQRVFHDWNNTAMGWAVPASIGAALAMPGKRIVCVVGDGSMQMNIQDLATITKRNLLVKIFVIDNGGYAMIRQTQDQWMQSDYVGSTAEGGLALPDIARIGKAYGFDIIRLHCARNLTRSIRSTLKNATPALCVVSVPPLHKVIPQVKFGRPNEDPEPLLSRAEFLANMIVPPVEASLSP
jgi:acetolactate synthase-1/2/3 large subunit